MLTGHKNSVLVSFVALLVLYWLSHKRRTQKRSKLLHLCKLALCKLDNLHTCTVKVHLCSFTFNLMYNLLISNDKRQRYAQLCFIIWKNPEFNSYHGNGQFSPLSVHFKVGHPPSLCSAHPNYQKTTIFPLLTRMSSTTLYSRLFGNSV